ncbi:MAG: DUF1015 family protein [Myxococcota bacterium]
MTTIRSFRALRYDPSRVKLADVLAPPYDVVAADDRHVLYERDPHNAVRLELTRDVADEATTDYGEVRQTLAAWQQEGVLLRDAEPALYALRQPFEAPDGSRGTREGFFALLHLEDYAARIVRPHERTLAGPKADRLKVLRAARANLSPVFLLYEDPDDTLAGRFDAAFARPLATADDAAGATALARVDDAALVDAVCAHLAERPVVIADGHHRYETALAYRDECRAKGAGDGPHEWILAYFANAYAPGSLLLPIHRLVLKGAAPTEAAWRERLPGWQSREVPIPDADAIPALLAEHLEPLSDHHAFAADDASGTLRLFWKPKDGELGVRVIHREVIDGVFGLDEEAVRGGAISYPKSAVQTARDLRAGQGLTALYLNALSPEDVFRATEAGEVMPQKSTFFHPKLPTGLVFRTLDEA